MAFCETGASAKVKKHRRNPTNVNKYLNDPQRNPRNTSVDVKDPQRNRRNTSERVNDPQRNSKNDNEDVNQENPKITTEDINNPQRNSNNGNEDVNDLQSNPINVNEDLNNLEGDHMEDSDTNALERKQECLAKYVGFSNYLFTFSIGLYPAIMNSMKNDDSIEIPDVTNLFNSILYFGAIIGVLISECFRSFDKLRKPYLLVSVLISKIGWMCMVFSTTYSSLLTGRFIVGLAMGIHAVALHYYVYEMIFINRIKTRNYALQCTKTDFFQGILIILIAGWLIHWKSIMFIVFAGHCLVALRLKIPESPHILLKWEEAAFAEKQFRLSTGVDTIETRDRFEKIRRDAREAIQMEEIRAPIPRRRRSAIIKVVSFILRETTGITVYYCYMTAIVENQEHLAVQFLLFHLVFGWIMTSESIDNVAKEFKDFKDFALSSLWMGAGSFLLAVLLTVQNYAGHYIMLDTLKILALQYIFVGYTSGWLYGNHILFEIPGSYYRSIRQMVYPLLAKFVVLFILTQRFDTSITGLIYFSMFFGLCSFLTSILFYKL